MPRKGFSEADKAKALRMLSEGQTQDKVAKKIGCSVFSLQEWKKKANAAPKKEKAEQKSTAPSSTVPEKELTETAAKTIERRVFSKDGLWADLFLDPKSFSAEEVVKIVRTTIREALK